LGEVTMIRSDASIVLAHSDQQQAGPTFKKTFGFHPLPAWCDDTDESLVIKLRPGRAGSNTAADHIEVLTEAIAQIPPRTGVGC
jgi:DDE family transposase